MRLDKIFLSEGRLKPGWRILLFFALVFPSFYLLTLLLWDELLIRYAISFWALLAISMAFARCIDKRPIATIGFAFDKKGLKDYVWGAGLGFVCVALLFCFAWTTQQIEIGWRAITIPLLKNIFLVSMTITLFQSAFEELLFRGYMFQNLMKAANPVIATLFFSILFGVGHLLTPHANWLAALNLSVFGILLSIGFLRTKSLWLSSGFHFAWNFFMRNIFALPVSGTVSSNALFIVKQKGAGWLTGGDYGPEAGIPALIVMAAASAFILFFFKKDSRRRD